MIVARIVSVTGGPQWLTGRSWRLAVLPDPSAEKEPS